MTNEEIFNNNINIAYKIANKYMYNYIEEIEDIRQIALIELWRSIENWDHIHALTTYAYIRISNEINMYLRRLKKHEKNVSINTIVYSKDDNIELEDVIEDPNDLIDCLLDDMTIKDVLNKLILTDIELKVIKFKKTGLTQKQIAKELNMTQPGVSRCQNRIKKKIINILKR